MVVIREALSKDLVGIINILEVNGQISDVDENDIKEFVVAEIDGEIVGCGMLKEHEDSFEIKKVSVLSEHQEKGIGRDITLMLLEKVKVKECWLMSAGSQDYWKKFGFRILAEDEEPKEAREYCDKCEHRGVCNRMVMIRNR